MAESDYAGITENGESYWYIVRISMDFRSTNIHSKEFRFDSSRSYGKKKNPFQDFAIASIASEIRK